VDEKVKTKRKRSSALPVDPAATDNLVGFFSLLFEIDRAKNPHLYSKNDHA
jgi:hypothetical protein